MCWIESLIFDNILNLNQTMKGIREELHKREKTPPFIWLDPFYFSRLEQRDPKTFIIPFIADVRSFLEVAFLFIQQIIQFVGCTEVNEVEGKRRIHVSQL